MRNKSCENMYWHPKNLTKILFRLIGEVRNVEISGATQQLLCSKSHDFPAVFGLAQSKINHIA